MQLLDARRFEEVAGVIPVATEAAVSQFPGMQRQVELGAAAVQRQQLGAQIRPQLQGVELTRLVVVEHLEQGVMAEGTRWGQGIDQLLERQVLMGLGLAHPLPRLGQQRQEIRLGSQLQTQYLGIDETADDTLDLTALAAGNGHANAQVALAGQSAQQGCIGRQQHREQRGALGARQGPEPVGLGRRKLEGQPPSPVAGRHRPRPITGQFQHGVLGTQALTPERQLAFALSGLEAGTLPARVVSVADIQYRKRCLASFQGSAIEDGEIIQQHLDRPAIGDGMVQAKQQMGRPPVHALRQGEAPQRAPLQIEGAIGEGAGHGGQGLRSDLAQGFQRYLGGLAHPLQGRTGWPVLQCGAQAGMTRHQGRECLTQGSLVQPTLQAQRPGQMVSRIARLQTLEKPEPLLGIGGLGAFASRAAGNRQRAGIQALVAQFGEKGSALGRWQRKETVGQGQGFVMQHQGVSSNSSSSASSASRRSSSSVCSRKVSMSSAWAVSVVAVKAAASGTRTPSRS